MKRGFCLGLACILIITSMMGIVSAEIMISQPDSIYNYGENLEISVEVSDIKSGFLQVNLQCDSNSANLYNNVLGNKKADLNIPLKTSYINDLNGDCKILANYAGESSESSVFKISNKVILNFNLDKLSAGPGDEIKISGEAMKENGETATGFLEIRLDEANINILKNIADGKISANFSLPSAIRGGEYDVILKVYEKIDNEITNHGTSNVKLSIRDKPTKIDIAIDKQTVTPGTNIVFKPILYDQVNNEIAGDIKVVIENPEEDVIFNKLIQSREEATFKIEKNFAAGYWTIKASSLDLDAKRLFYIEENEEAEFKLENATLIITNIGNVPYRKSVQIVIGNELEIAQMDLDLGESMRYRLAAPDGQYKISVTDGSKELNFGDISLTGNVVGIMRLREEVGMFRRYPIVWLFLIVVLGLFILMLINRVVKKKVGGYRPKATKTIERDKRGEVSVPEDEEQAKPTLVLKGNKEESGILALKFDQIINKSVVDEVVREIKSKKGVIYKTDDYIIGIFTPTITKTFENEIIAVKVAEKIKNILNSKDIKFGMGVNVGNIVAEKEGKSLKFTSLGNTLNLAKKIANVAKKQVLISKEAHQKSRNIIKVEREEKEGLEVYSIKSIIDRDRHKEFINNFLRSQKLK